MPYRSHNTVKYLFVSLVNVNVITLTGEQSERIAGIYVEGGKHSIHFHVIKQQNSKIG